MGKKLSLVWLYVRLLVWPALIIVLFIVLAKGCNMLFNNRYIQTASTETTSYAKGLVAHIEYTKYKDGSEDVKKYPDILGHRYLSSTLYQNFDGDDFVDRIRKNGPEWKMHRLKGILVRETDYEKNKKEFDKGDKLLAEVRKRAMKK